MESNTAQNVGQCLLKVFSRLGFPVSCIFDGGSEFVNATLDELTKLASIIPNFTKPYYHVAHGLAESNVKSFVNMLKKLLNEEEQAYENWHLYCPFIELYMYNRIQELTHSSAFALCFGRHSNLIGAKNTNESLVALSKEELRKRWHEIGAVVWPSILERVKEQQAHENSKFEKRNLIRAPERDTSFAVGDHVMAMRAEYADGKPTNKFASPYFGPICITDVDKRGNYRGYDMDNNKITRWFPPAHLKPYSRPLVALDQRTNIKGHGFDYLVSYDEDL
jgi:hypothetical protein